MVLFCSHIYPPLLPFSFLIKDSHFSYISSCPFLIQSGFHTPLPWPADFSTVSTGLGTQVQARIQDCSKHGFCFWLHGIIWHQIVLRACYSHSELYQCRYHVHVQHTLLRSPVQPWRWRYQVIRIEILMQTGFQKRKKKKNLSVSTVKDYYNWCKWHTH